MGADRAADRHGDDGSHSGVSELRLAATSAWRHGLRTGSIYPPSPQSVPFYQKMFSLYGNTGGTPLAVLGCPFDADGTSAAGNPPNGNGCANRQSVSHSSDDHEQVQTVRIDYNINAEKHGLVPLSGGHGCKLPTPIPSIRCSMRFLRSRSIRLRRDTRTSFRRIW